MLHQSGSCVAGEAPHTDWRWLDIDVGVPNHQLSSACGLRAGLGKQVVCGTSGLPTATVQMLGPDGITHVATGLGTGPVDAAYKAIDSLVRVPVRPPPSWPAGAHTQAWLREQRHACAQPLGLCSLMAACARAHAHT